MGAREAVVKTGIAINEGAVQSVFVVSPDMRTLGGRRRCLRNELAM